MAEASKHKHGDQPFARGDENEAPELGARHQPGHGAWRGLGMMGLVGWALGVPTVAGVLLGIWLDARHPARHSWTLTLLLIGAGIGCVNAWQWVAREQRAIRAARARAETAERERAQRRMVEEEEASRSSRKGTPKDG